MFLRHPFLLCLLIVLSMSLGPSAGTSPNAAGWSSPAQEKPGPEQAEEAEEEEAPWDVNAPPGETFEVGIDTDEGTWMSLDVSPDGFEVIFDLLGDLYAIPIAGGEARALTEGMAWDMQPRYSPDGKSIAFTSDRGGGDNLWVMGRDGSDPRQVTKRTSASSTARPGRPTANSSPAASISLRAAAQGPERSGSIISRAARACR